MRIVQEEVFGPFTVVLPFDDEEEAIAHRQRLAVRPRRRHPHHATSRARTAWPRRMRCGIVWINDHHRLDPALPWGGVKESGMGASSAPSRSTSIST